MSDPDDMAWQFVNSFMRNKVELQAFLQTTLDSMPPVDESVVLTAEMRQKVLNHMYKVMINTLTNANNSADIKDAFLSEAIQSIQNELHVENFMGAPVEVDATLEEVFFLILKFITKLKTLFF